MTLKNALITGITGQDGSYLAELLLSMGYEVYGLVRRTSQNNLCNIKHILHHDKLHLLNGDVTDFASVCNAIRNSNPQEIYNLAAQSHVGLSFEMPTQTLDVVGRGALHVFEAARQIVPSARIYQASSSEQFGSSYSFFRTYHNGGRTPISRLEKDNSGLHIEYGDGLGRTEFEDSEVFQDEDTPFSPQSPYGCAKVYAHNTAKLYRKSYRLHISCGILFNHESERRGENFVSRKITKHIGKLLRGGKAKLKLGNLYAYRDWGHAQDYVHAMWLMLQRSYPDDYVIATGNTHTVQDFLLESLKSVCNDLDINKYVEIDSDLFRPAEVNYLRGVAAKAEKVLGWKPKVSFVELVRRMIENDR